MSFGGDCLIKRIDERILGIEGSTYKSAQLSGAIDAVKTSFCCVPTLNDLPTACDNEGRFVYVEDIKSFRYSDGYFWTKDACSVLGDVNTNAGLWSWGCNDKGQLGDGTTVSRCSPGTIWGSYSAWRQISSYSNVSSGIKCDGTLWTWGGNINNGLGDGDGATSNSRSSPGTVAGGGTTWCLVSIGDNGSIALKTDGTIWTWGLNNCGQLGDGSIATRDSPGTVAGGGTNWCWVSTGQYAMGAIKTDGTLWTWGISGASGALGDGTTVNRCSPGTIWGGGTTWCRVLNMRQNFAAIKTDGTLWTWGNNSLGRLGDGTTVSRCSPGTVAGGGTSWCAFESGCDHVISLKTDGTLWTWGANATGTLGNGTTITRCSPGTVAGGGTTWCQVGAGYRQSAAIKTDGTIWTWGRNCRGVLGDGTTISRCSPGTIINSPLWSQVSVGDAHMIAIKTRGF